MSKLLFLYSNVPGGVRTYIDNLTSILKCENREYKVITYENGDSLFNTKIRVENNYVRFIFSRYSTIHSRFIYLKSEIDSDDVLICSDFFELEAIRALRLANKVVYVLHGDLNHYKSTINENLCILDLVLCVSNGLMNKYAQLFPGLKFGVSHPFVLNNSELVRRKTGCLCCVYIGRFEYLKGADLFLKSVGAYGDKASWTVVTTIIGSDLELLTSIPQQVQLHKDITNEQVLRILEDMDVLILPSRTEGFGIAVLEAMSKGVIPIAMDIPIGIPDQIIHGYNGFLLKEERWIDAVQYLQQLEEDNSLLMQMKLNAIQSVEERFNARTIVKGFIRQVDHANIRKDRKFMKPISPLYSRVIPEPIYRILKMFHNRILA